VVDGLIFNIAPKKELPLIGSFFNGMQVFSHTLFQISLDLYCS